MARFQVRNFTTSCPGEMVAAINENENITQQCLEIVARGKKTFFVFEDKLTSSEITELNNVIDNWSCPSVSAQSVVDSNLDSSEPMAFSLDTSRGKMLSAETTALTYSESNITNMDWVQIGHANDSDIGTVMPYNGTVIRATGFCENVKNSIMNMHLYINTLSAGSILTFSGNGPKTEMALNLNIDFNAGDIIRLRGVGSRRINDTAITIWCKWRKV